MSIIGIGVDIINNNRLKKLIKKKEFLNRVFTPSEIKTSNGLRNKINYYSKRFAAKEAFSKATGSGISKNIFFKDIEIVNDKMGKPYYLKSKKISKIIQEKFNIKKYNCFLSISDEKDYSTAFTIIQSI